MEAVFAASVAVLILLALVDLWVGVTNDAVNFLNSAIGARISRRRVILFVAGAGVLFGALFSSGLMEVARKGVFNPDLFVAPDGGVDLRAILALYVGVMAADVIMLDLFNSLGLPTSTTVSIVSELVGASVAVNLWANQTGFFEAFGAINAGPVGGIYTGIFLSVLVAFTVAALVMFLMRWLFTHDLSKTFPRYGWILTGLALPAMTYFVLFKGLKDASFLDTSAQDWLHANVWPIMGVVALVSAGAGVLLRHRHKLVFSALILAATSALAMAFASNDLVNFIGPTVAAAQAVFVEGVQLSGKLPTPGWALLIAGAVMVVALYASKKAKTVTDTEVRLAAQGEMEQRWRHNGLASGVVTVSRRAFNVAKRFVPASLRRSADRRTAPPAGRDLPPYDLLRASVNLTVAAALISVGTANKLPLSTTYITFMAAMGASLADRTWGSGSAAARVSGVLTVLGGWVMTGLIAAGSAFVLSSVLYLTGNVGPAGSAFGLVIVVGTIIWAIAKLGAQHEARFGARRTVVDDV